MENNKSRQKHGGRKGQCHRVGAQTLIRMSKAVLAFCKVGRSGGRNLYDPVQIHLSLNKH